MNGSLPPLRGREGESALIGELLAVAARGEGSVLVVEGRAGFASHVPYALRVPMDLVEAAVRTGRHDEAAAHVAAMRQAGLTRISPGSRC